MTTGHSRAVVDLSTVVMAARMRYSLVNLRGRRGGRRGRGEGEEEEERRGGRREGEEGRRGEKGRKEGEEEGKEKGRSASMNIIYYSCTCQVIPRLLVSSVALSQQKRTTGKREVSIEFERVRVIA